MLLLALLIAIPRVLCWDIQQAGQTVNFQLQVGTIRGIGHVEFLPDCPPDLIITPPVETTTDAALVPPHTETNPRLTTLLLDSTETTTHTVVKKVTRTVVVTVTDQSQPTTPAISFPASESWVWVPPRGTLPTAGTNVTANSSFTVGLPSAPSFVSELALSPGNALVQRVWAPFFVMIVVGFGQSCF